MAKVQAVYRKAGHLEAHFTQRYTEKLRQTVREESGQLYVQADGRLAWLYVAPNAKSFIFDGHTAYFYEPSHAQVTVFERFAHSPVAEALALLTGQGSLAASFAVGPCTEVCDVGPKERAVGLVPRQPQPQISALTLVLNQALSRVLGARLVDPLGNRSEYRFSAIVLGQPADPALFVFVPPEGTDLLRASLAP